MDTFSEQHHIGLDALQAVTTLLRRIRITHPTAGLYEAADLQWWWGQRPRTTDAMPQLFWVDADEQPVAAVVATDFGSRIQLDPIVLPDAEPAWVAHVLTRGLRHAGRHGIEAVSLEVDDADHVLIDLLLSHGFTAEEEGVVESWLAADRRPPVSALPAAYRLFSRADTTQRPHHMISPPRNHPDLESRLRQTSLYRPDLDLVILASGGEAAAYGLFWYDSATATGLVEPMRTDDAHQRRGLARHVLTTGIDRLAACGAERIKICFEPGNPASSALYLDVGFQPDRHTVIYAGPTNA